MKGAELLAKLRSTRNRPGMRSFAVRPERPVHILRRLVVVPRHIRNNLKADHARIVQLLSVLPRSPLRRAHEVRLQVAPALEVLQPLRAESVIHPSQQLSGGVGDVHVVVGGALAQARGGVEGGAEQAVEAPQPPGQGSRDGPSVHPHRKVNRHPRLTRNLSTSTDELVRRAHNRKGVRLVLMRGGLRGGLENRGAYEQVLTYVLHLEQVVVAHEQVEAGEDVPDEPQKRVRIPDGNHVLLGKAAEQNRDLLERLHEQLRLHVDALAAPVELGVQEQEPLGHHLLDGRMHNLVLIPPLLHHGKVGEQRGLQREVEGAHLDDEGSQQAQHQGCVAVVAIGPGRAAPRLLRQAQHHQQRRRAGGARPPRLGRCWRVPRQVAAHRQHGQAHEHPGGVERDGVAAREPRAAVDEVGQQAAHERLAQRRLQLPQRVAEDSRDELGALVVLRKSVATPR
mmetsp:Transcript_36998/g.70920  ORF Transcript_36998/g.70920 Transcript_36998/m.70920 type:complete len:453 (+) Transcript_36998:2418-3776(+)